MAELSPALARLEALLADAGGGFVAGKTLATAIGIPMVSLSGFVAQLRRQRPQLVIEGRSGRGYRMVAANAAAPPAPMSQALAPKAMAETAEPTSTAPGHAGPAARPTPGERQAAAATLLALIGTHHAEIVKTIALDSSETVETTINRLIAYGIEVHHDLVLSGTNPLALRRPKPPTTGSFTRH